MTGLFQTFLCSYRQLRAGKRAVRIQRVKEPLLLALCTATATAGGDEEDKTENDASKDCFTKPIRTRTRQEIGPNMVLDTELYEGIVSQTIIEPKVTLNSNFNRFKMR